MNGKNMARILAPLVAAYPRHLFTAETAELYRRMLADIPAEILEAAVLEHICESPHFPTLAELRRRCVEMVADIPAPEEAWVAVRRFLEAPEEERQERWQSLPAEAQEATSAVGGRVGMVTSDNPEALRAQWLAIYRALRDRRMRRESLPPEVRARLEQIRRRALASIGPRIFIRGNSHI